MDALAHDPDVDFKEVQEAPLLTELNAPIVPERRGLGRLELDDLLYYLQTIQQLTVALVVKQALPLGLVLRAEVQPLDVVFELLVDGELRQDLPNILDDDGVGP